MLYPEVFTVIPVPTFAVAKVKIGDPPKDRSSPDIPLNKVADPVVDAAVVPS